MASVLSQHDQHRPAEIIVVDDASHDSSAAIAEDLGARVLRHDRNGGAAAARNTAVAAATQPWVALLDADDEWLGDHLATLWPLRGNHVLVSGACASYYDDHPQRPPEYAGTVRLRPQTVSTPAALIPQNFIMASAVIVRKDVIVAAGGYSTDLRYAEDWDLWLRVLEYGTALATPQVVSLYHRHSGQKSQHRRGPAQTHERIVRRCADRSWWSARVEERWLGLRLWDELEEAFDDRRWLDAGRLAALIIRRPRRLVAVVSRQARYRLWQWHSYLLLRSLKGPNSVLGKTLQAKRSEI